MFINLSNSPLNPIAHNIVFNNIEWVAECIKGLQGQKLGKWMVNHSDVYIIKFPFEIEHNGIKMYFDQGDYIAIDLSYKNQADHSDEVIVGLARCNYNSHDGETY